MLWLVAMIVGCGPGQPDRSDRSPSDPTETTPTETTPTVDPTPTVPAVPCPDGLTDPNASTSSGCVTGRSADGVEGFVGIPYAEAPVGELRWARPAPITQWETAFAATTAGSPCPQTNGTVDFELAPGDGDEDCLYLNVLRPEGTEAGDDLPVVFFIHGGGHIDGHGASAGLLGNSFNRVPDDAPLLEHAPELVSEGGVVLVTINYRLAQLGWIAHPGLSAENADGASGNQGLWDALLALEWASANAQAFGGDPDNLMIFGESAGSVSVCSLLAAPAADGLFSAAILQSGVCTQIDHQMDAPGLLVEAGYDQGARLAELTGCDAGDDAAVIQCLRDLPLEDVMAVMHGQWGSLDVSDEAYGPLVDGVLLPSDVGERLASGQFSQVPVIMGVNADEGTLFTTLYPINSEPIFDALLWTTALVMGWDASELQAIYDPSQYGGDVSAAYAEFYTDLVFLCPAREMADAIAPHTDVHAYYWTHSNPLLGFLGAFHGVEISYVFGTGLNFGADATMTDNALASWSSVAAGTPEVPGVGAWPLFGGSDPDGGTWVEMSVSPQVIDGPRQAVCDWMDL